MNGIHVLKAITRPEHVTPDNESARSNSVKDPTPEEQDDEEEAMDEGDGSDSASCPLASK